MLDLQHKKIEGEGGKYLSSLLRISKREKKGLQDEGWEKQALRSNLKSRTRWLFLLFLQDGTNLYMKGQRCNIEIINCSKEIYEREGENVSW